MTIKIPEITLSAFEAFGDEKLEAEFDRQEKAVDDAWRGIYDGIASGKSKIAHWDTRPVDRPGYHVFMRYALHRSTKRDGFLQLSVMEIGDGEIIPTSDSQHGSVDDFLMRAVPFGAVEVVVD